MPAAIAVRLPGHDLSFRPWKRHSVRTLLESHGMDSRVPQSSHKYDWSQGDDNPRCEIFEDEKTENECCHYSGRRNKSVFGNSENANRKSRPGHALLPQPQEIETGGDARELDLGSQDHNVIFEPSRPSGAEEFVTTSAQ